LRGTEEMMWLGTDRSSSGARDGDERAAARCTSIGTAKLNEINPEACVFHRSSTVPAESGDERVRTKIDKVLIHVVLVLFRSCSVMFEPACHAGRQIIWTLLARNVEMDAGCA
jgi:hypothetical protein